LIRLDNHLIFSISSRIPSWTSRPVANLRWYSDDEKPDKKEKVKSEKPKIKSADAAKRLNALLENMSATPTRTEVKVQTAPSRKPKKVEKTQEESIK
jgi:hypothetical protein